LDAHVARRIVRKVTWFSQNFERVIPEPLAGDLGGTFKLRVGDWRVVYSAEGDTITVWVIGHRREIYRMR